MAGPIAGPGQGLQVPQLYPANLLPNGELFPYANEVTLAAGQQLPIPRGRFWIELGGYAVLQFLDPVTTVWRVLSSARVSPLLVDSDGFNFRVANLTGCAVGAIVTTGGATYVASTTTITPSAGNSTWIPVIGGAVSTTVSIVTAGGTYTVPPQVYFPPPPAPGVAATGIAVLSSGTVSSITIINQGAGYTKAPVPQIFPNPTDPNYTAGSVKTNATATTTLVGSGALTALLCSNPGSSFATVPSLTIAGGDSTAAATIVPMWTLTGTSITNGGASFGTNGLITSIGGVPSATPAYTNPATELTGYIPRPAQVGIAAQSGGTITTIGTIYDGGLFAGTPVLVGVGGTGATIAATLGSRNATVILTKAD